MYQAAYKEQAWHKSQEKIELLIFEKIILASLLKFRLLGENLQERVKKEHLPN